MATTHHYSLQEIQEINAKLLQKFDEINANIMQKFDDLLLLRLHSAPTPQISSAPNPLAGLHPSPLHVSSLLPSSPQIPYSSQVTPFPLVSHPALIPNPSATAPTDPFSSPLSPVFASLKSSAHYAPSNQVPPEPEKFPPDNSPPHTTLPNPVSPNPVLPEPPQSSHTHLASENPITRKPTNPILPTPPHPPHNTNNPNPPLPIASNTPQNTDPVLTPIHTLPTIGTLTEHPQTDDASTPTPQKRADLSCLPQPSNPVETLPHNSVLPTTNPALTGAHLLLASNTTTPPNPILTTPPQTP